MTQRAHDHTALPRRTHPPQSDSQLYAEYRAWQTRLYRTIPQGQVTPEVLCLLLADLVHTAELIDTEVDAQQHACTD